LSIDEEEVAVFAEGETVVGFVVEGALLLARRMVNVEKDWWGTLLNVVI